MDHFGIGAAMRAMVNVYRMSARRTGRTTSLLESLRDGDRVVCAEQNHRRQLEQLCRERNLKVQIIVIDPKVRPLQQSLAERGTPTGRLIFDHTWVEKFYEDVINENADYLDFLQREYGGFGTAHIETRQAYIEQSKWRV